MVKRPNIFDIQSPNLKISSEMIIPFPNISSKEYSNLNNYSKRDMSAVTITFGDQAENHKGMQIIGKMADKGYSI